MADENDRTETSEPETPETEAAVTEAPESGETEPAAAETPAEDPVAVADEPTEAAAATEEAEDEAAEQPRRRRAARRAAARADDDAPARRASRRADASTAAARRAADGAERPVVRAHAKYVRSSARKARLVCDHIRGKSVEEARAILAFAPRAVAKDWSKLLESAVANAEHNHELDGDDLVIKAAHADEGPTLKRFRPRAMGRATPIRKRTSHLTILLTPKE